MQENNLEGKVHDIMEGFTIDPSEKVWGKIEADLAGQKKSRFGMLPAALLTGCFLLTTFILHDLEKRKPSDIKSISSVINNETTSSSITTTQGKLSEKEMVAISQKGKIKVNGSKDLNTDGLYEKKQQLTTANRKMKGLPKKAMDVNPSRKMEVVNEKTKILKYNDAVEESEIVVTINYHKKDSLQQTASTKNLIKIDSTIVKEEKQEQTLNKTIAKTTKNNKWEFFATASGGKFYTGNSYLSQIPNAAYYNSNLDMTNGSGIPSPGSYQPSMVKSGFSYSLAVKASKKLSRKAGIGIGLGYQYASTSIRTGQPLNGSSRENFATGSVNEFHNKYHFIQVPVEIQSIIGKGKKLPLYWNAGLSFSRLISADALQFDRTQGRYFKDNSYFNKNSIGISGGLSLAILKKQKTQWLIGPQFYYSLTPVAGKGLYDKTHYSFLGIQLQKKL